MVKAFSLAIASVGCDKMKRMLASKFPPRLTKVCALGGHRCLQGAFQIAAVFFSCDAPSHHRPARPCSPPPCCFVHIPLDYLCHRNAAHQSPSFLHCVLTWVCVCCSGSGHCYGSWEGWSLCQGSGNSRRQRWPVLERCPPTPPPFPTSGGGSQAQAPGLVVTMK